MSSGDFSGTINISSQTRQHLFNYLFLTGTHFTAPKYILSSWTSESHYITKSSEEKYLSSIRVQVQIKFDFSFCFNSPLSCQSAQSRFVIGSCSSLSPSPVSPQVLWCYELCQSHCSDPDTRRPSSLPPHPLRTLISHNIPRIPSANRKWHSSHR